MDCFIRKDTPELRATLAENGYTICKCCDFEGSIWLSTLKCNHTIHGIGYGCEEYNITPEQALQMYIDSTSCIDCGEDEILFIKTALEK